MIKPSAIKASLPNHCPIDGFSINPSWIQDWTQTRLYDKVIHHHSFEFIWRMTMRGLYRHPLPPGYSGDPPTPPKQEVPVPVIEDEEDISLDDTLPLDLGPASSPSVAPKIHTFEQKLRSERHEDSWTRTPNSNGTGAIHVKSFHCKLTGDSLEFLDQQINEWLDAHPQYEVKFVTSSIGTWTGKSKEPNMIVNVWV